MGLSAEVRALSDHVIHRTRARLAGLSDDEFTWTLTDGGWHAWFDERGQFHLDFERATPDPAPITSLAWRLMHLMGVYSSDSNAQMLNLETGRDPMIAGLARHLHATDAVQLLTECQDLWSALLDEVTDETLTEPLGPKAGPFGDATGLDFVLHQIDEQIHHGAEVALLRDLYRVGLGRVR